MNLNDPQLQEILNCTRFISHIPLPNKKEQDSRLYKFTAILPSEKSRVLELALEDQGKASYSIGAFVGMALGDSISSQWQFTPIQGITCEERVLPVQPLNYLGVEEGQFTDVTSMALGISESLLTRGEFDPVDTRKRWYHWWYSGYCSGVGQDKLSVGCRPSTRKGLERFTLNPSKPFVAFNDEADSCCYHGVVPLAIFYRKRPEQAIQMSQYQSYVTQGSETAAVCCATFCFLLVRLIHLETPQENRSLFNLQKLVQELLLEWSGICHLQLVLHPQTQNPDNLMAAIQVIQQIVTSKPENGSVNQHWNWRQNHINLEEIVQNKKMGRDFRGVLTTSNLFGCNAPDSLSLALHVLVNGKSLSQVFSSAKILGGNSTGVSSIVGALLGTYFGYSGLVEDKECLTAYKKLMEWDAERVTYTASLLYCVSENSKPVSSS